VFDAFVDAATLRQWHCPRGMSVLAAHTDARVDGPWRLQMRTRDGSIHVVGGRYLRLERPARLAYTWRWEGEGPGPLADMETLIEVEFSEQDGGTLLRMRHTGFPDGPTRDAHGHGWRSTFNRLTDLLDERGSAATVTLIGDARSTYTRTARMGLAEKSVAYTHVSAAPHTPEVLAVHPFGRIPAMRDGEIELWETSAILRYVEESFDGPSLLPGTVRERARCEQWVSLVNGHLYDTMGRRYVLQYALPRGEGGQPDRAVIDKALTEMPAQLDALDRVYAGSEYLAGATVSMADLFVTPILAYLQAMPESAQLLRDRPNVLRALATMKQRPSFAATEPQPPAA
jgi:glutathione S-transferase